MMRVRKPDVDVMTRVPLTRDERRVLRLALSGAGCPATFPRHVYTACVDSLERKGLLAVAWVEGHTPVLVRVSDYGRSYIAMNPRLRNPVDWKWVVTTGIAVAGLVAAVVGIVI